MVVNVVVTLKNMSSTELKLQIISKITTITDELILEEIYRLVNRESGMDSVYRLTDAERNAIAEGLEDVKEGRVYSSEAAEIRESCEVSAIPIRTARNSPYPLFDAVSETAAPSLRIHSILFIKIFRTP